MIRRGKMRWNRNRRRVALLAAVLAGALAAMLLSYLWPMRQAPPAASHRQHFAPLAYAAERAWPPAGFRALLLSSAPARVIDGDTFEADIDGDGRLEFPRERVRLLYVDAPELSESHKGKDPLHGLPARDFLAAALAEGKLRLLVPAAQSTGKYGRTLAVVHAGERNVNLALIRAGHAYFDTRFQFPSAYARYAAAEGEAFDGRRGIWATADSRRRYLARLRREHKTPAGRKNSRYVPGVQSAPTFQPRRYLGRYVHLEGRLTRRQALRKGVQRLLMARGAGQAPLPVVALPRTAERLGVTDWEAGMRVRVEGFVQTYKGRTELLLHYGVRLP